MNKETNFSHVVTKRKTEKNFLRTNIVLDTSKNIQLYEDNNNTVK